MRYGIWAEKWTRSDYDADWYRSYNPVSGDSTPFSFDTFADAALVAARWEREHNDPFADRVLQYRARPLADY